VFHSIRFEVLRRQRNRIALLRLTPLTTRNLPAAKAVATDTEGVRKESPTP
jgi:hypothetical protein